MSGSRATYVETFHWNDGALVPGDRVPAENEGKAYDQAREAADRAAGAAAIVLDRDTWGAVRSVTIVARFGELPDGYGSKSVEAALAEG